MVDRSLHSHRTRYVPPRPNALRNLRGVVVQEEETAPLVGADPALVSRYFPVIGEQSEVRFVQGEAVQGPLRVGVVFSGGQAPGGHNVVAALFDGLKELNPGSRLYGFLGGPDGIVKNKVIELESGTLEPFRNSGGFNLIGSGRTKIESEEQFQACAETVGNLSLDGLIVIGGDDSNTNAALLAEYFRASGSKLTVVGVPKTIDGDLKGGGVEISFGFDTASKVYAELIGNVARDALSSKKYYFFIKLMGRSASHLTLECALQTQPNLALIGEEIAKKGWSLEQLTAHIADLVEERGNLGKDYGIILIPEGVIEFIPEFGLMIQELNRKLSRGGEHSTALDGLTDKDERVTYAESILKDEAQRCFRSLPPDIQLQLLLDRDPHGNVLVSQIDTERLLIAATKRELKRRGYARSFKAQPAFFGYEGRSAFPSNFDANYCHSLGLVAALLVDQGRSGYLAALKGLSDKLENWQPRGVPISRLVTEEIRHGKEKPVIRKALVDLTGEPFRSFSTLRDSWRLEDAYRSPGPIQYFGPSELTDAITETLALESQAAQILA